MQWTHEHQLADLHSILIIKCEHLYAGGSNLWYGSIYKQ